MSYGIQPDVNNPNQLSTVILPGTQNRLGGVKQGANVAIAADGTISVAATAAQVNSDWLATSGLAQVLNKPPIASDGTTAIPKFGVQSVFYTTGPISNATGTLTSHGGTVVFFLHSTAYSAAVVVTGINFNIDGTTVALIKFTFNEASSHKTLPPTIYSTKTLAAGAHACSFTVIDANLQTDATDYFQCYAIEFPF